MEEKTRIDAERQKTADAEISKLTSQNASLTNDLQREIDARKKVELNAAVWPIENIFYYFNYFQELANKLIELEDRNVSLDRSRLQLQIENETKNRTIAQLETNLKAMQSTQQQYETTINEMNEEITRLKNHIIKLMNERKLQVNTCLYPENIY